MAVLAILTQTLAIWGALQESDWVETHFHRVHLLNGNFIDGQLLKDIPTEVRLKLKAGEMGIRRDQIDFVEFIKMRTINERPKVVAPPSGGTGIARLDLHKPAPEIRIPGEIQARVNAILAKLKASKDDEKTFPTDELRPLGEEAGVYLASRLPALDPEIMSLSVVALATLKYPATIPVLADLLTHANPRVRGLAAASLGYMGDAEKERYLRPMLEDPEPRVRQTVLGVLASVDKSLWFEPVARLCADPDKDVRSSALTLASRIAKANSLQGNFVSVLQDLLDRGGPEMRSDAASAIGGLGEKGNWPILVRLLNDTETSVRSTAAYTLMNLAAPESGPSIITQLSSERDRKTRVYLAGTAQRLRLLGAIRPLVEWLFDSDEEIQKTAQQTLSNLTGQTFGADRALWEAWLNKAGIK